MGSFKSRIVNIICWWSGHRPPSVHWKLFECDRCGVDGYEATVYEPARHRLLEWFRSIPNRIGRCPHCRRWFRCAVNCDEIPF